jgi:hypothetical protein
MLRVIVFWASTKCLLYFCLSPATQPSSASSDDKDAVSPEVVSDDNSNVTPTETDPLRGSTRRRKHAKKDKDAADTTSKNKESSKKDSSGDVDKAAKQSLKSSKSSKAGDKAEGSSSIFVSNLTISALI